METQNVVRPHNGVLLSLEEKGRSAPHHAVDEPGGPAQGNGPAWRDRHRMVALQIPRGLRFIERAEWRVPRAGGLSFPRDRDSALPAGRALETMVQCLLTSVDARTAAELGG